MQKLLKVGVEELKCVKSLLLDSKMEGYQENNKDRIIEVVLQMI